VAAKRGKSQARRNNGREGGLPGWAWLVLGVAITVAAVFGAPRVFKSGGGDGFFRPRPNPDAQPAPTRGSDDAIAPDEGPEATAQAGAATAAAKPKSTQYDFYTMLPGNEVVMSDAELAATERDEAARRVGAQKHAAAQARDATVAAAANAGSATPDNAPAPTPPSAVATTTGVDAPYLLQAGAFGASGDAEATKAKVALLGLSARVESAAIDGKTVYRVRMGPYGTASELAEAKRKLANGGLPAMAIKVK
jgi:cell division protein FtsN